MIFWTYFSLFILVNNVVPDVWEFFRHDVLHAWSQRSGDSPDNRTLYNVYITISIKDLKTSVAVLKPETERLTLGDQVMKFNHSYNLGFPSWINKIVGITVFVSHGALCHLSLLLHYIVRKKNYARQSKLWQPSVMSPASVFTVSLSRISLSPDKL